ncbi:hypothetical protein [Couchioplanes caeruleus]|uniref:Tight adherence protein B n=2 Tax=Couchioplanes caeruleus TaxID=56438 RepID=A0A1K0GJA8_9ACTN|nr:hypothetical protein [Couchioplanes caeruleus]OJF12358.1 hypothetical protein BG844_21030 [Couchioplanes caeruleus subsp. caeruleus]ROP30725.1 tight adherence protein B [Couchioplanes caeruleus]
MTNRSWFATAWPWLSAAVLLATAAIVAVWPVRRGLARLSTPSRRATAVARVTSIGSYATRAPRRFLTASAAVAALLGTLAAGPTAAFIAGAYAALTARALIRRAARRHVAEVHERTLDALSALAADLRVGLSRPSARIEGRPAQLAAAAERLAERTGAPTADLIERIEADARAAGRARAGAAAQAAGAQATAILLAALPLGGIALGYGIGVDPLHILLHTPTGAACAAGAALLQTAGLLWADRLTDGPPDPTIREPSSRRGEGQQRHRPRSPSFPRPGRAIGLPRGDGRPR